MDTDLKARLEQEHGVELICTFTETWWAFPPNGNSGKGQPISRNPALIEEWLRANSETLRKEWAEHRERFLRTLDAEQREFFLGSKIVKGLEKA